MWIFVKGVYNAIRKKCNEYHAIVRLDGKLVNLSDVNLPLRQEYFLLSRLNDRLIDRLMIKRVTLSKTSSFFLFLFLTRYFYPALNDLATC